MVKLVDLFFGNYTRNLKITFFKIKGTILHRVRGGLGTDWQGHSRSKAGNNKTTFYTKWYMNVHAA